MCLPPPKFGALSPRWPAENRVGWPTSSRDEPSHESCRMADGDALTNDCVDISVVDVGSSGYSRCLGRQLVSFDTLRR